jgi:hypothetical protein
MATTETTTMGPVLQAVLTVPLGASNDVEIGAAIVASNKLFAQFPLDPVLFHVGNDQEITRTVASSLTSSTLAENLKKLKISFCRQPHCTACEDNCLGHTERRARVQKIFLNNVFSKRLVAARSNAADPDANIEIERIVFLMAVTIYHEMAHVILRWRNILQSPGVPFEREAGLYSERRLFGGTFHAELITTRTSNSTERFVLFFF